MISNRARFALHGLCYLAMAPSEGPTSFPKLFASLKGWSERLTLSKSYVGKVFQDLSRAGLVRAVPGRHGGYRLARPASEMTVLDVVRAMDRPPDSDCCLLADGSCPLQDGCGVLSVVEEAERAFFSVLGGETIEFMAHKMARPPAMRRPARAVRAVRARR